MSAAAPLPIDLLAAAVARAPLVRRLTTEQRAILDADMEEIRAGRAILVPHDHMMRVREEVLRHEADE